TSNPVRRRRIIHDQKYPNDAVVALYRNAYTPINDYFRNGRQAATLIEAAERLRADQTGSEWAIDDRWNTADALEKFAEIADNLPSQNNERYFKGEHQPPKLAIYGVD